MSQAQGGGVVSIFPGFAATYHGNYVDAALNTLAWVLSIGAGFGILFGAVFLMPAITSLIASVFVDDVAEEVERVHYPADRLGTALPIVRSLIEGSKTAAPLAPLVWVVKPIRPAIEPPRMSPPFRVIT